MRAFPRLIAVSALLFLGALVTHCARKPAPADAQTATRPSTPRTPSPPPLLGDMTGVVSVKELMKFMIDPLADNVFQAVWWNVTRSGTHYYRPTTQADWDRVQEGAVTMAEGIYLLKVPRPFAPSGDVNNSTGPNPPELSPTQIQAKIAADPVLWNAKIEALRNVALEVIEIVKRKNVDELFAAGGDLDKACEACHLEYWYPGDRLVVDVDARPTTGTKKPERKR